MDWDWSMKDHPGDISPEAEADFREILRRMKAEGRSKVEIALRLQNHPFLVGLVWDVTRKGYLKKRYLEAGERHGQRNGKASGKRHGRSPRLVPHWEEYLATDPDFRTEWRVETLIRVDEALFTGTVLDECDPEDPHLGGYFRRVVEYKAIDTQWAIWKRRRLSVRYGRTPKGDVAVYCFGEGLDEFTDRSWRNRASDCHIDVLLAIRRLTNQRVQDVVYKRVIEGCSYAEIGEALNLTYDQVRYAVEIGMDEIRGFLEDWG